MPATMIPNPGAIHNPPSSYLTHTDGSGNAIVYPRMVGSFRANDTIAIHDAVGYVASTATVQLSVEKLDVSDAFAALVFAGVATEAAVAGDSVQIVMYGPAIVNIDDAAPTFGDVATKHATTDGCAATGGTLGGTWDATDVAGAAIGTFISAEIGTTNRALINVCKY